ncbi:bacteriophage repressor protein C1 [Desmospora sp. 8437]|nr:bacteriophage repressor protein C1 [Desmospora sp. 8437]
MLARLGMNGQKGWNIGSGWILIFFPYEIFIHNREGNGEHALKYYPETDALIIEVR